MKFRDVAMGVSALAGLTIILNSLKNPPFPDATYPDAYVDPVATASVGPRTDSDKLMEIARREFNLPDSELSVRGLLPSDLGLTTYTFNLVAGWNTIVNSSANNKVIMLTGVTYSSATPVATEVKVYMGSSAVESWSIQGLSFREDPVYTDTTPSIAREDYPIRIQVYSSGVSAGETISFQGIVVEPRGITLA